jgi:hypothetical protein
MFAALPRLARRTNDERPLAFQEFRAARAALSVFGKNIAANHV